MSAVALGLGLLAALVSQPAETPAPAVYPVYFVSPEGDDALPGLAPERTADGSDGPFRSIQRAREVLRGLAQPDGHPNGAVVYLREGTYALSEPIVFGPQDSGRDKLPVMFRNYKTEAVRVTGGVRISDFEPHEGSIVKAKVADLLPPGFRPTALYCDGERQHLSRWPNAGEGELPGGGWTFVKASDDSLRKQRFFYSSDRPAKWAGQSGVEVSIWPNYNWWQTITGVKAIDTTAGTVELSAELPYTIEPGRRLFFQNIFSELDSPGEWWYDMAEGMLYFWPPKELANAEVMIPVAPALFRVEGAQNLNLMGMTLEITTGEAVTMKDATACLFAKSTVRNVDGFGVTVSGGAHCRVLGNDVYHTGRGAIELTGGDRKTLTRANHQAINNHIHDFGVLYQTYQTGVNVNGVGNIVAHNLIHDAPHIGILLAGNEHIIEYNDIHHVCLQGSDNGGFYMGRDWTQRGNKIRYNKFHDIYGFGLSGLGADGEGVYQYETPHQAWGIYLDDCSSGTTVYGNWFYRVPLCGVMIGGGRDNVVENNIFVDCTPALHIDNRWDAYPWDLMNERLEAMSPTQPPYSDAYPELLKMGDDPRKPENNRFVRNIVYYAQDSYRGLSTTAEHPEKAVVYNLDHFDPASTVIDENLLFHEDLPIRIAWSEYGVADSGKTLTWQEWREKGFDKKSVVKNPMFVDPDRDDYTLAPASPAKEIGFKPIAAHLMGLIDDEFRVSPAPARDERRDGAKHQRFPVKVE